jgi:hypothetical protein
MVYQKIASFYPPILAPREGGAGAIFEQDGRSASGMLKMLIKLNTRGTASVGQLRRSY